MWAFGVTIWELYNTGALPYTTMATNEDVINAVLAGTKLSPSKTCPDYMANITNICCSLNEEDRPTFATLVSTIQKHIQIRNYSTQKYTAEPTLYN